MKREKQSEEQKKGNMKQREIERKGINRKEEQKGSRPRNWRKKKKRGEGSLCSPWYGERASDYHQRKSAQCWSDSLTV